MLTSVLPAPAPSEHAPGKGVTGKAPAGGEAGAFVAALAAARQPHPESHSRSPAAPGGTAGSGPSLHRRHRPAVGGPPPTVPLPLVASPASPPAASVGGAPGTSPGEARSPSKPAASGQAPGYTPTAVLRTAPTDSTTGEGSVAPPTAGGTVAAAPSAPALHVGTAPAPAQPAPPPRALAAGHPAVPIPAVPIPGEGPTPGEGAAPVTAGRDPMPQRPAAGAAENRLQVGATAPPPTTLPDAVALHPAPSPVAAGGRGNGQGKADRSGRGGSHPSAGAPSGGAPTAAAPVQGAAPGATVPVLAPGGGTTGPTVAAAPAPEGPPAPRTPATAVPQPPMHAIQLQVNPPGLGALDVRIQVRGGEVDTAWTVAHSTVQGAILSGTEGLAQSLGRHGLNLAGMQVGVRGDAGQAFSGRSGTNGGFQQPQGRDSGPPPGSSAGSPPVRSGAGGVVRRAVGGSRLDLVG